MRRIFTAVYLAAAALSLAAPALAAPAMAAPAATTVKASFNTEQKQALDRISAALNAIHTMKGGFVQIDPNGGLEQGKFYIEKPGRMRFEYDPPTPTLIVSNGTTIAVKNTKLNTVDRYPLISTPLDFVLSDHLDLKNNDAVTSILHNGDSVILKAHSTDKRVQGDITLVFSAANFELRQWTVIDPQGLSTTVALRNVQTGIHLDPALFVMKERNRFTKGDDD
jgi:outer membrane lipoprotein-sorting protein